MFTDSAKVSFSLQKSQITREHRQECFSIIERIFADGLSMKTDVIVINFFALVISDCKLTANTGIEYIQINLSKVLPSIVEVEYLYNYSRNMFVC